MINLMTAPDSITRAIARTKTATFPAAATLRRLIELEPSARILYVDDEPQCRRFGALVLVQSGYAVDTADDGAEGWDALQHTHYNLLITDQEMPRLTGLELAKQARLAGMRLPIVLASGSVAVLHDPATHWLEFAACLPKPFGGELLVETVERALRVANNVRQCSGAIADVLARFAHIQAYRHGGINE